MTTGVSRMPVCDRCGKSYVRSTTWQRFCGASCKQGDLRARRVAELRALRAAVAAMGVSVSAPAPAAPDGSPMAAEARQEAAEPAGVSEGQKSVETPVRAPEGSGGASGPSSFDVVG